MKKHFLRVKNSLRQSAVTGIIKWLGSHKRYAFLAAIAVGIIVFYTAEFKAVITLAIFGIISSTITTYKRVIRMPPVLELISLTTVMVTLFYGPIVGIFYTIIVNLASEVMSGYPDVMTLTYLPSRTVQVLFVWIAHSLNPDMGIAALGIWSVIIFNLVQQPVFMFLTDAEQRLKAVYFVALNIPINILIFKFLAVPLYTLLKLII